MITIHYSELNIEQMPRYSFLQMKVVNNSYITPSNNQHNTIHKLVMHIDMYYRKYRLTHSNYPQEVLESKRKEDAWREEGEEGGGGEEKKKKKKKRRDIHGGGGHYSLVHTCIKPP